MAQDWQMLCRGQHTSAASELVISSFYNVGLSQSSRLTDTWSAFPGNDVSAVHLCSAEEGEDEPGFCGLLEELGVVVTIPTFDIIVLQVSTAASSIGNKLCQRLMLYPVYK